MAGEIKVAAVGLAKHAMLVSLAPSHRYRSNKLALTKETEERRKFAAIKAARNAAVAADEEAQAAQAAGEDGGGVAAGS